jgi:hypothetical protein
MRPAQAQASDYSAAIDEAVSAFAAGDWPLARASFAQALADERKPLSAEQTIEVDRFLRSAKLETCSLELQVTPSGAQLRIDGMPRAPGKHVLARGTHTLEVEADGQFSYHDTLVLDGAEARTLAITLERTNALVTVRGNTRAASAPASRAESERSRLLTWVTLASAPVLAGAGVTLWLAGKSKFDALQTQCETRGCTPQEISDEHLVRYSTWSSVSFVAAGAALLGGGVLYFAEGAPSPRQAGAARVEWSVSPTGLSLRGRR